MQSQNNSIQLVQADSTALATGLGSLQQTLFQAAEENIRTYLGEEANNYSSLQMRSMIWTEALRLTSGIDLSTILTRGSIIKQIEDEGLHGVHPNGYANLTTLAEQNGVAVGELSDIRSLCEIIFPYIQNELGLSLVATWEEIGKSSFREMVPALRSLITGENASHNSVRQAVEAMLNGAASAIAIEENCDTTDIPDVEVRRRAVSSLLSDAATMPTRQLRRRVRPSRVDPIEMATLQTGDNQWYAVMQFESQEQKDLALRILNPHTENQELDARGDAHTTRRSFLGSLFGE
jgi:hypothetical protein